MTHVKLVNTSAINEKASVPATLDTFLLVMDLAASNVLLQTSLETAKSPQYLHGMLPYVILAISVSQIIAVEQ